MRIKFFIVLLVAVFFMSCVKDEFSPDEWGIEPELEVRPLALIFTPSNLVDTVRVTTNYLNFHVSSFPKWLNIEKIGTAPALIVSADDFTGKEHKREAYVTITVKRGNKELSRDFVAIQFKNDVFNLE